MAGVQVLDTFRFECNHYVLTKAGYLFLTVGLCGRSEPCAFPNLTELRPVA